MKGITETLQILSLFLTSALAWIPSQSSRHHPFASTAFSRRMAASTTARHMASAPLQMKNGNLHGQNACFLPLKQLDQDYHAPRIVQIAGAYPGITREEFFAVSSEPCPEQGQWAYDFSDPDGPQLGTVALEGSTIVAGVEDPVVIIAEHTSLALPLPDAIKEPVDLVVLVDRAKPRFGERKFLVIDTPGESITIGAFNTKAELPEGCEILGQVELVQVPWLPSMAPTKTGFMEADEYF